MINDVFLNNVNAHTHKKINVSHRISRTVELSKKRRRSELRRRRRSVGLLQAAAPPELLSSLMDPLVGDCRRGADNQ